MRRFSSSARQCFRRSAIVASLVALAALAVSPAAAQAATVYVSENGNDAPGCGAAAGPTACRTLMQGVAVASASDTVQVGAGTFPITAPDSNGLEITKPLVLRGNQFGSDARQRSTGGAGETVLNDGDPNAPTDGLLTITASGAGTSIDGFTITGNRLSKPFVGAGVLTKGGGGYTFANNIITANSTGLYLASADDLTTVTHNQFRAIGPELVPGTVAGDAIYSELAKNVTISANSFIDNPNATVIDAIHGGAAVSFTGNQVNNSGSANFTAVDGLRVADNTITGGNFSAIVLGGRGLQDAQVVGNTITDKSGPLANGIRLLSFAEKQNRGVTIAENTLTDIVSSDQTRGNAISLSGAGAEGSVVIVRNRIVDNSGAGLRNEYPDAAI